MYSLCGQNYLDISRIFGICGQKFWLESNYTSKHLERELLFALPWLLLSLDVGERRAQSANDRMVKLTCKRMPIKMSESRYSTAKLWHISGQKIDWFFSAATADCCCPREFSVVLPTDRFFGRITSGRIKSRAAGQSCGRILTDFVQKEPKKGRTSYKLVFLLFFYSNSVQIEKILYFS